MAVVTQFSLELLLLMMTISVCLLPSNITRLFVFQVLGLSFELFYLSRLKLFSLITIIIIILILNIIVVFYFQFLYYNFSFQIWDIINQCRS